MKSTACAHATVPMVVRALFLAIAATVIVAPALAQTRPSIAAVELIAGRMERLTEKTEERLQTLVDRTLDQASFLGGQDDRTQRRLFRLFSNNEFRVRLIGFRGQDQVQQLHAAATRRLDRLEFNPEARQLLDDARNQFQNRIQQAQQNNNMRLQSMIFSVGNPEAPIEPNGLLR